MGDDVVENKAGYKTAFKSTSLFGGVQFITIIISLARSKVVAIWLGPAGFGLLSLFNTVLNLIFSITNLGLASSGVRDIAQANSTGDAILLSQTVKAVERWSFVLGIIGLLITCFLSSLLSKWTFDNNCHVLSFVLLSVVILFMSIYRGNYAIIQGTRHLSYLAKSSILGAILSFLFSLPLFYFLREDGIVYSLIISAVVTFIISFYYKKKIKIRDVEQSFVESYSIGISAIKLGLMMSISAISVCLVEYIVKIFIANLGGITDVGFYQAGWVLNVSYLGLVFTAMATDYFPRLSLAVTDSRKVKSQVNEQAEIAILILGPLIIGMILFLPLLIRILYSDAFLVIVPMTRWLLVGSLIKAGSWAISFVFLAKGDGKVYLFNELGIKLFNLPCYLLFYYYFGLTGIGIAYICNYLVYFAWVAIASYKKYKFKYKLVFWRLLIITFLFSLLSCFIHYLAFNIVWNYIIGSICFCFSLLFSIYELNKRLNILEMLSNLKKRINKDKR